MFEDIAQMETEIETFRQNIIASSELVKGIRDLTDATRQQKESFLASSEALKKKLEEYVKQFKADHDESLEALDSSNAANIEKLHQSIASHVQEWLSALGETKAAIESCEASATAKTDEQITRFTDESERIVSEMQSSLAAQQTAYRESLEDLESSNAANIEKLQKTIATDVQKWLSAIGETKAAIESCEATAVAKTDEQIGRFTDESERIISEMQSSLAAQQISYRESLEDLESSNAANIEKLQQSISADVQEWLSALGETKAAIESCEATASAKTDEQIGRFTDESERIISEMQSSLAAQHTVYLDNLKEAESVIREYQSEAEKKYLQFVQRLETTNVDQIFKEVQDLKKSIQQKFVIQMIGMGIVILVLIISIIVK